jgi:uncharacterized repeat protein (TIGR01451 family)
MRWSRSRLLLAAVLIAVTGGIGSAQRPSPAPASADRPSIPEEGKAAPPQAPPRQFVLAVPQADLQQQDLPAAPMIGGIVTVGVNFEASRLNGANGSGSIPPDTEGAVGPRHIMEFINGNYEIFDKTTGTSLENDSLANFWINKAGIPNGTFNNGRIFDPKIIFDPISGRWFATSEDNAVDSTVPPDGVNEDGNNFYIARSDSDDPTGTWQAVQFDADQAGVEQFHDYPQMGIDADGLYICTQDFPGDVGGAESCYSFPKADLLANPPSVANATSFESSGQLPGTDGSWQPAINLSGLSNGRAPILGTSGGALQRNNIFGANAGGATLGVTVPIAGDPGHDPPPAARQPDDSDTGDGIETIENVAPRFVANPVIVGNSMWAVHAVEGSTPNNSALRWYEINETTNTIIQTGVIDDPNVDFHEPSIAVNQFGHVVIGYTCSGPTLAASVCVSVGTTAAGATTFQAPAIVFAGQGTYYNDRCNPATTTCNERNRWGDYSRTIVDPVDPATFWTIQEYTAQDAGNIDVGPGEQEGGLWGVRVVELTFNELTGGDLSVSKSCKPDPAFQTLFTGQTGFCEVSVTNFGPNAALNVVLVDRFLSNGTFSLSNVTTTKGSCTATPNPQVQQGTVTCELGRLDPNQTVLIHVDVSATTAQTVNNTARVTSDSPDPDPTNNEDSGTLVFVEAASQADLSITKTDSPDPVVAGTNLTYSITVTNNGPSAAVNVVASDLLSSSLSIVSVSGSHGASCNAGIPGSVPTTCNFDGMANGAIRTMTIVTLVNASVPAGTILSNNASVTSATADNNNSNNLATTSTTVDASADLAITKTDSPDPVTAGGALTYTLTITNAGPSWARNVVVSDTLPLNVSFVSAVIGGGSGTCSPLAGSPTVVQCQLGDIANGGIRTVTLQTQVAASVPDGAVLTNTASVGSTTSDPVAGNNNTSATTNVVARADIWVDKTGVQITGNPSRTIRYTLAVYNKAGCESDDPLSCGTGGPSDAQNVVVTDTLPLDPKKLKVVFVSQNCTYNLGAHNVVCNVAGALPAGQIATFIIDVQVSGSVGSFTNDVSVTTSTTDPNLTNNSDQVKMVVKGGTARPSQ